MGSPVTDATSSAVMGHDGNAALSPSGAVASGVSVVVDPASAAVEGFSSSSSPPHPPTPSSTNTTTAMTNVLRSPLTDRDRTAREPSRPRAGVDWLALPRRVAETLTGVTRVELAGVETQP